MPCKHSCRTRQLWQFRQQLCGSLLQMWTMWVYHTDNFFSSINYFDNFTCTGQNYNLHAQKTMIQTIFVFTMFKPLFNACVFSFQFTLSILKLAGYKCCKNLLKKRRKKKNNCFNIFDLLVIYQLLY